jgi:hypothetical protein
LAERVRNILRKLIAIHFVVASSDNVRLCLPYAVQIDHAVVQPYAVARHADDALHQINALLGRIGCEEDRRVSAVKSTVRQQPAQLTPAQRREPIDKYMVAHQQRLLHGA